MIKEIELRGLVLAAMDGDRESLGVLLEGSKQVIYLACSPLLRAGQQHSKDDVAQEVALAACKNIKSLKEPHAWFSWLRTTARRMCINHVSRYATRDLPHEELTEFNDPATTDHDINAEGEYRLLVSLIRQLNSTYSGVLLDFHTKGMNYNQIAAARKLPLGTVKRRICCGRKRLASLYQGENQ